MGTQGLGEPWGWGHQEKNMGIGDGDITGTGTLDIAGMRDMVTGSRGKEMGTLW